MHPRLNTYIFPLLFLGTLFGSPPDEVKSYLWGLIQFKPSQGIKHETGYWVDQALHRREFHAPLTFAPVEIRYGAFFLGGGGTEGKNIKSDWIKYDESVSNFTGGSFTARLGHQLDIDFIKTNLFYYFLNASWLDMQTGLNFRYSNLLIPGKIDKISSWGSINPSWDIGNIRFAPRILTFGISHTTMFQWFELWYIDTRFTYGISTAKFYMDNKDQLMTTPTGFGPTMSVSAGPRFIINIGNFLGGSGSGQKIQNRFSVGLDLRYAYTKLNTINDPDNVTPIKKIRLQDFGIHLTFSVLYGGSLTSGDKAKDYFYRGDYITANKHFKTFLENYPNHSNRVRAEKYIAECREQIPIQLYKEGVEFENKGMMKKGIDRFLEARKRANKETKIMINEKLNHLAILEIEKAEKLSSIGKNVEAIRLMENIAHFSQEAKNKIPYFEAKKFIQESEKALKYGFFRKSLELLNQAIAKDKSVEFEVNTLRYQVATHLVKLANTITSHSELRSAIQLLKDASEMTGGLGEKNEKVLAVLMEKFEVDQEREMYNRIDARMEDVRIRSIDTKSNPPISVGMTVPDIQSLLGSPDDIIKKIDNTRSSIQLWIYPLEGGGELHLSFKDYILFKVERTG
ncbi:MAG: hypothetical protein ACE5D0_04880 [Fidelibacterota bacterium]